MNVRNSQKEMENEKLCPLLALRFPLHYLTLYKSITSHNIIDQEQGPLTKIKRKERAAASASRASMEMVAKVAFHSCVAIYGILLLVFFLSTCLLAPRISSFSPINFYHINSMRKAGRWWTWRRWLPERAEGGEWVRAKQRKCSNWKFKKE